MQMTTAERQDYNKLTREQKEDFEYHARKHPDWEFQMVMIKLAFEEKTDETIENGGKDVDPNDINIWMAILKGVKTILSKFKSIGKQIFNIIDNEITFIQEQIKSGIRKINDAIVRHFFDEVYKSNDHALRLTKEEQQQYDKLSQSEKEKFDCQSKEHPNWTFCQVVAKLQFDKTAEQRLKDNDF